MKRTGTLAGALVAMVTGCNAPEAKPQPQPQPDPAPTAWAPPKRIETTDADCERCEMWDDHCGTWVRNPEDMDLNRHEVPCDPVCCEHDEQADDPDASPATRTELPTDVSDFQQMPQRPTNFDLAAAIRPHRTKVDNKCLKRGGVPKGATVEIELVFSGATGKVESATPITYADSGVAKCAVKLLKEAEVARFADKTLELTYELQMDPVSE